WQRPGLRHTLRVNLNSKEEGELPLRMGYARSMPGVGAYLRELRERQGVSIDEIARSTRVLHHYLEALESDDLASLPAPVFAKGFIRAYCQALGVPADEAIALYDQRAGHVRERVTIAPALAPPPPPSLLPPPTPA